PGRGKRRDERPEARSPAAPAVNEEHRFSVAPGPPEDGLPPDQKRRRLCRREQNALPLPRSVGRRRSEKSLGRPRRETRRHRAERSHREPHRRELAVSKRRALLGCCGSLSRDGGLLCEK